MAEDRESWAGFVRDCLRGEGQPEFRLLAGDASVRRFYRVSGFSLPAVLMVNPDPPCNPGNIVDENETWVYLAGLLGELEAGPPAVYGFDRTRGLILAEDLGDRLLQAEVLARGVESAWTADIYHRLLDILARVQVEGGRKLDPARIFNGRYDADFMYRAEGLYFARNFAEGLCGVESGCLDSDLMALAETAGGKIWREVLLYRDFQSRNVMLRAGDRLRLIDFQGARPGPPAYDAASLLYDPYVPLGESLRLELRGYFRSRLESLDPVAAEEYEAQFTLIAAHRLMQVLGAYAKLARLDGKTEFLRYAPRPLADLKRLLEGKEFSAFETLRRVVARLKPPAVTGSGGQGEEKI